jgi:hypothetical protein
MVNRFKQKYGPPSAVLIAFGDHEQRHQMRHHEPTKDVGIRRLFHKHGYLVYLIDEYRTSCRCYQCGSANEMFLTRASPRPWRKQSKVSVHGLLRCRSVKCKTVYNRDFNACQNLISIAENIVNGCPRPADLCRGKQISERLHASARLLEV